MGKHQALTLLLILRDACRQEHFALWETPPSIKSDSQGLIDYGYSVDRDWGYFGRIGRKIAGSEGDRNYTKYTKRSTTLDP